MRVAKPTHGGPPGLGDERPAGLSLSLTLSLSLSHSLSAAATRVASRPRFILLHANLAAACARRHRCLLARPVTLKYDTATRHLPQTIRTKLQYQQHHQHTTRIMGSPLVDASISQLSHVGGTVIDFDDVMAVSCGGLTDTDLVTLAEADPTGAVARLVELPLCEKLISRYDVMDHYDNLSERKDVLTYFTEQWAVVLQQLGDAEDPDGSVALAVWAHVAGFPCIDGASALRRVKAFLAQRFHYRGQRTLNATELHDDLVVFGMRRATAERVVLQVVGGYRLADVVLQECTPPSLRYLVEEADGYASFHHTAPPSGPFPCYLSVVDTDLKVRVKALPMRCEPNFTDLKFYEFIRKAAVEMLRDLEPGHSVYAHGCSEHFFIRECLRENADDAGEQAFSRAVDGIDLSVADANKTTMGYGFYTSRVATVLSVPVRRVQCVTDGDDQGLRYTVDRTLQPYGKIIDGKRRHFPLNCAVLLFVIKDDEPGCWYDSVAHRVPTLPGVPTLPAWAPWNSPAVGELPRNDSFGAHIATACRARGKTEVKCSLFAATVQDIIPARTPTPFTVAEETEVFNRMAVLCRTVDHRSIVEAVSCLGVKALVCDTGCASSLLNLDLEKCQGFRSLQPLIDAAHLSPRDLRRPSLRFSKSGALGLVYASQRKKGKSLYLTMPANDFALDSPRLVDGVGAAEAAGGAEAEPGPRFRDPAWCDGDFVGVVYEYIFLDSGKLCTALNQPYARPSVVFAGFTEKTKTPASLFADPNADVTTRPMP
jgi:hypothetical protein